MSSFARRVGCAALWVAGALAWAVGAARGRAGEPDESSPPREQAAVAATVGNEAILVSEVDRELQRFLADRPADPRGLPRLRATVLEQLVKRRLVLAHLARGGRAVTTADVDLALSRVEKQLAERRLTLDAYLRRGGLTRDELRGQLAWQLGWERFLREHLTDANLRTYFQRHAADFDGRRVKVAQALFRVEPDTPENWTAQEARAAALRADIVAGKLSFAEAARRHSQAPSGKDGGGLGFIERRAPMTEAFSKAAFALEPGAISPPVRTAHGVHLIQCLEIEPGQRRWEDVREELAPAVTEYLFDWAAGQERPHAKIRPTGATPYFHPETGALVEK